MSDEDKTVKGLELKKFSGKGLKIAIVSARWNHVIVNALIEGCQKSLLENEVLAEDIRHIQVPGSFELPFGASSVIQGGVVDAVICIGVLIKGETMHFEYIAGAASQGIMDVGLKYNVPVIFGILTCLTEQQALARAGLTPNGHNHGVDWGLSAIEMVGLKNSS